MLKIKFTAAALAVLAAAGAKGLCGAYNIASGTGATINRARRNISHHPRAVRPGASDRPVVVDNSLTRFWCQPDESCGFYARM